MKPSRIRQIVVAVTVTLAGWATTSLAAPPHDKTGGAPAMAQQKHGKKGEGEAGSVKKTDRATSSEVLVRAGISVIAARELARQYDATGYQDLPPGIRKNLARGKPLPPGLAKRAVPQRVLDGLPRHPGYEWQIAGTDLILVAVATLVIADVLHDVFN